MKRPRIGLALGGGGARGFAHIGVLQVFQQAGIAVDCIAGTSMGAVVGAIYAETLDAREVEQRFADFLNSKDYQQVGIPRLITQEEKEAGFWDQFTSNIRERMAVNMARNRKSIIKSKRLQKAVKHLISIESFDECRIPLTVLATDLLNGGDVPLTSGDLYKAVTASASIPGFLPPVPLNGRLLSDGGTSCPVPVRYARGVEPTVVVGVGVPPPISRPADLENALEIINRAEQITSLHYSRMQMQEAEFQIYPEMNNVHWYEFERMPEIIEAGKITAETLLPQLEKLLADQVSWWQRVQMSFNNMDILDLYRT